jgi:hypothetical protein
MPIPLPVGILSGLEVRIRLDNAVPSLSATIKTNPASRSSNRKDDNDSKQKEEAQKD